MSHAATVGRVLVIMLAAALLGTGVAAAQCSTQASQQFSVSVSPSPIVFGQPTSANFNAGSPGLIDHAGVYLSFTPRRTPWYICIRYASGTATLGNGKATGDLLWSATKSTWAAVTAEDQVVLSGTTRSSQNLPIYLRMLLRWASDSPFTYGADLVITGSY